MVAGWLKRFINVVFCSVSNRKEFDAARDKEEQEYEKSGRNRGNNKDSEEDKYVSGFYLVFRDKKC